METADNFSAFELVIIRQQLSKLTDGAIAEMINKPADLVHDKINEIISGSTKEMVSKSQLLKSKALQKTEKKVSAQKLLQPKEKKPVHAKAKAKKEAKANAKLEREQKKRNQDEKLMIERTRRLKARLPDFETKAVDYSQMVSVRIDRQTTIYAKPGEDIALLKKNYLAKREQAKITVASNGYCPAEKRANAKKKCARCNAEKPLDDFAKNKRQPDGRITICKVCEQNTKRLKSFERNNF